MTKGLFLCLKINQVQYVFKLLVTLNKLKNKAFYFMY